MDQSSAKWIFPHQTTMSLRLRQKLAVFIHDLGKELEMSDRCICASIVLMHRFYSIQPSGQVLPQRIAAAIVFLTCKIFDCPKALQDVVLAFLHLLTGKSEMLKNDIVEHYRNDLIKWENVLLSTFGFDFHIEFPHDILTKKFDEFKSFPFVERLKKETFLLATKSLYLSAFSVTYSAEMIASFAFESTIRSKKFSSNVEKLRRNFFQQNSNRNVENLIVEFEKIVENYPTNWFERIFPMEKPVEKVQKTFSTTSNEMEFSLTLEPSDFPSKRVASPVNNDDEPPLTKHFRFDSNDETSLETQ